MPPTSTLSAAAALVCAAAAAVLPRGTASPGDDGVRAWSAAFVDPEGERGAGDGLPAAAFHLERGQSPHPEVAAGPFVALFRAQVTVEWPGEYRFGAYTEGGLVELIVVDAEDAVLWSTASGGERKPADRADPLALEPQELTLYVAYEGDTSDGPAGLRTTWSMAPDGAHGFDEEPIPVRAVRYPEAHGDYAAEERRSREGRVLLEELGCTGCHPPSEAERGAVGGQWEGVLHVDLVVATADGGELRKAREEFRPVKLRVDRCALLLG